MEGKRERKGSEGEAERGEKREGGVKEERKTIIGKKTHKIRVIADNASFT